MKKDNTNGVWRTVGGRRIFIKDGQSLESAMKESGKFNNKKEKSEKKKSNEDDRGSYESLKEVIEDEYSASYEEKKAMINDYFDEGIITGDQRRELKRELYNTLTPYERGELAKKWRRETNKEYRKKQEELLQDKVAESSKNAVAETKEALIRDIEDAKTQEDLLTIRRQSKIINGEPGTDGWDNEYAKRFDNAYQKKERELIEKEKELFDKDEHYSFDKAVQELEYVPTGIEKLDDNFIVKKDIFGNISLEFANNENHFEIPYYAEFINGNLYVSSTEDSDFKKFYSPADAKKELLKLKNDFEQRKDGIKKLSNEDFFSKNEKLHSMRASSISDEDLKTKVKQIYDNEKKGIYTSTPYQDDAYTREYYKRFKKSYKEIEDDFYPSSNNKKEVKLGEKETKQSFNNNQIKEQVNKIEKSGLKVDDAFETDLFGMGKEDRFILKGDDGFVSHTKNVGSDKTQKWSYSVPGKDDITFSSLDRLIEYLSKKKKN